MAVRFVSSASRIRLVCADIASLLMELERLDLLLWEVRQIDLLTLEFYISGKQLSRLRDFCQRNQITMQTMEKIGWSWPFLRMLRRPVLLVGTLTLLLLTILLPRFVLFVCVEGNTTVPSDLILEKASLCGIGFGVKGNEIRNETVKNQLLEWIPQLQWVGIRFCGCVVTISVHERNTEEYQTSERTVSSLVAARDGIVRSVTVLTGSACCRVGDSVKAGDVLISGYTDFGSTVRAEAAQGEVFAETTHIISVISPLQYKHREDFKGTQKKFSLIIGKKRINFYNSSGISDTECVRIYSEKYVTLPGGFQLPIGIATEEIFYYSVSAIQKSQVEDRLMASAIGYVQSNMVGGSVIAECHKLSEWDDHYRIDCVFQCIEMIGIIQAEERLDNYENRGKNG